MVCGRFARMRVKGTGSDAGRCSRPWEWGRGEERSWGVHSGVCLRCAEGEWYRAGSGVWWRGRVSGIGSGKGFGEWFREPRQFLCCFVLRRKLCVEVIVGIGVRNYCRGFCRAHKSGGNNWFYVLLALCRHLFVVFGYRHKLVLLFVGILRRPVLLVGPCFLIKKQKLLRNCDQSLSFQKKQQKLFLIELQN